MTRNFNDDPVFSSVSFPAPNQDVTMLINGPFAPLPQAVYDNPAPKPVRFGFAPVRESIFMESSDEFTAQPYHIELPYAVKDPKIGDMNVYVCFQDGSEYTAWFFTPLQIEAMQQADPGAGVGGDTFEVPNMVVVNELTQDTIGHTVAAMLKSGEFQTVFERCEPSSL